MIHTNKTRHIFVFENDILNISIYEGKFPKDRHVNMWLVRIKK